MLEGLSTITVELCSKCNKNCFCCGRRKREKENPEIIKTYGYMPFNMIQEIARQLPSGIWVQTHWNGEATLHPQFGEAVKLFKNQFKNVVTNGKLLLDKYDEIVDNLDTISISVIENDPESEEQYNIIKEFVERKGNKKPLVVIRANGDVDVKRYEDMNLIIAKRILHAPEMSKDYYFKQEKRNPIIPEIGVCLDFLHKLAIDINGNVSVCVRYDINGHNILGNIKEQSLEEIWNGEKRKYMLQCHLEGRRDKLELCSQCDFFGVPTGP